MFKQNYTKQLFLFSKKLFLNSICFTSDFPEKVEDIFFYIWTPAARLVQITEL